MLAPETQCKGVGRSMTSQALRGFWGPRVLPLPDFANAPYPAPPGTRKISQMGISTP